MDENQDNDGTFEMSLRVLGNELIGFSVKVDDFQTKWLLFSILAVIGLAGATAVFGPDIMNLLSSSNK